MYCFSGFGELYFGTNTYAAASKYKTVNTRSRVMINTAIYIKGDCNSYFWQKEMCHIINIIIIALSTRYIQGKKLDLSE